MLCWLYDEDRWPSGSAGGIVTKNVQYRSRFLVFEPEGVDKEEKEEFMSAAKAVRSKNRFLLGSYRIILNEEGRLKSYQSLKTENRMKQVRYGLHGWKFQGIHHGLIIKHM